MIRIVRARTDHAPPMAAVHERCFPSHWSAEEFRRLIVEDRVLAFAALETIEGKECVIGFALAQCGGPEADIISIGVLPERRRQGIAQALLRRLFEAAGGRGVATLFLEVAADNAAAERLYRRTGFAEAGRRARYYRRLQNDGTKDTVDALLMRAELAALS